MMTESTHVHRKRNKSSLQLYFLKNISDYINYSHFELIISTSAHFSAGTDHCIHAYLSHGAISAYRELGGFSAVLSHSTGGTAPTFSPRSLL
ncbi:uncharacterized protein H6S33_012330 [Morchella sextelata]|uniref:uncharacterized protein n=1 Tax=Morchella sextelata TaxID=1174677 RepID=UPI001D03EB2F|nr:uncharacterized protein H6S33_012330 [Morchella sextelata]KAH0609784.1 hypothetical protein H6S33_012330 [Morchella sextelata]